MKSEQLDKLAIALNKAQGQLKAAVKDKENPFFHSKYATLGSVWDACREALLANGFSVIQHGTDVDGKPVLTTTLLHASGQWISGDYLLNPIKNDPQAVGSAWTYARRYGLAAMVGVVTDEDDDGNAAAAPGATSSVPEAIKKAFPESKETNGNARKTTLPKFTIKSKSFTSKKGNDVTSWHIINEDGVEFGTINKDVANAAMEAEKKGQAISVWYTQNGKFYTAERIEVVELEEVGF